MSLNSSQFRGVVQAVDVVEFTLASGTALSADTVARFDANSTYDTDFDYVCLTTSVTEGGNGATDNQATISAEVDPSTGVLEVVFNSPTAWTGGVTSADIDLKVVVFQLVP